MSTNDLQCGTKPDVNWQGKNDQRHVYPKQDKMITALNECTVRLFTATTRQEA